MNVSSAGSTMSMQSPQRKPEAAEVRQAGGDHDGDADDGGAKAVRSAPAPTVNTSGQKLGQVINVTA
jgi:hypothetical protein